MWNVNNMHSFIELLAVHNLNMKCPVNMHTVFVVLCFVVTMLWVPGLFMWFSYVLQGAEIMW